VTSGMEPFRVHIVRGPWPPPIHNSHPNPFPRRRVRNRDPNHTSGFGASQIRRRLIARRPPIKTAATSPEILPTGIEPVTFSSGGGSAVVLTSESKALTARLVDRCTNGCTENAKRRDELPRMVALVAQLPGTDDERAAVLARLVGKKNPQ